MAIQYKYYKIDSFIQNSGDFVLLPRGSSQRTFMVGIIIPLNILNVGHWPLVTIEHKFTHNGSTVTESFTADKLRVSTSHTFPNIGFTINAGNYYYFENALSQALAQILPATDTSIIWSPQITVPNTFINNIPALVTFHNNIEQVVISWNNSAMPDPLFQSNNQPLVSYYQKYQNDGNEIIHFNNFTPLIQE